MRRAGMALAVTTALATAGGAVALAASTSLSAARLTSFATCLQQTSAADTDLDEDRPGDSDGTKKDFRVKSGENGKNKRGLVRFDLAGCGVPAGAQVTGAQLSLWLKKAPSVSRDYRVRRVAAAWTEDQVTWADQPAVAGSPTATTASGTADNVRIDWAVTADIQAFVSGGATNRGWRIEDASEGGAPANEGQLTTRDEDMQPTRRPRLDVAYYP